MSLHPGGGAWAAEEKPSDLSTVRSLMAQEKWEEAVIILRSLQKATPASFDVIQELARALTFSGRRQEAISQLMNVQEGKITPTLRARIQKLIQVISRIFITNTNFMIYQEGVNFLEAGKYQLARTRFETALKQEPDHMEIRLRMGQSYCMENDLSNAEEHLLIARKLNPYEPEVALWLGRVESLRGEHREAAGDLKWARQQLPRSQNAIVWQAEALIASGQRDQALLMLKKQLKKQTARQPAQLAVRLALLKTEKSAAGASYAKLLSAKKQLEGFRKQLETAKTELSDELDLGLDIYKLPEMKQETDTMITDIQLQMKANPVEPTNSLR